MLLTAVLSLSALSLSFSSPVKNMKGSVRFFGNSPFEYPGFQAEDGSQYTLEVQEGAEFTLDDISSHSGELIELSGKLKKKKGGLASLSGGHIIVESYEILSPLEENPLE
ncbi:MAG: hypothetical protein J6Y13_11660 [Treponema sp.]|nr:hypothetical protein [Treponema sp.]